MTPTQTLATFCADTEFKDLPATVVAAARMAILDTLACALGTHSEDPQRVSLINRTVQRFHSEGACTVVHSGMKTAAPLAAFANGVSCHGIDFDDLHSAALTHTSAVVLPAALASAEECARNGQGLITSFVIGYEVAVRLGMAVMPSHYEHWHSTATNGTFGAAAAAGKNYGLDRAQFAHALGFAGAQAAGLLAYLDFGDFTKSFNPGKAAFNGVLAAWTALAGAAAPSNLIEGKMGYVQAYSAAPAIDRLTAGLAGERREWEILRNLPKLYPSLSASHTAIEATRELLRRHSISPSSIAAIKIYTHQTAVSHFSNRAIHNAMSARLSIPYCVAACAADGDVTLASFHEAALQSPALRRLLEATSVVEDPALSALYPDALPARVEITTTTGETWTCEKRVAKGGGGNPLSFDEVSEKFRGLAVPVIGRRRAEAVIARVERLEEVDDVRTLCALLR